MSFHSINTQKPTFARGQFAPQAAQAPAYGQGYASGSGNNMGGGSYGTRLTVGTIVKGRRFASGLIDLIVMIAFTFIAIFIIEMLGLSQDPQTGATRGNMGVVIVLALLVPGVMYGTLMESSKFQGTLGKILTNCAVTDYDGYRLSFSHALMRNVLKILSGLAPFYIAYLMIFFTQRKQTLHDMIGKTVVRKKLGGYSTGY